MIKVNNNLSFQGEMGEIQSYNSSFLKTKCKVFAFGKNRNASSISELAFDKARKSLAFIPVVANYSEKEDTYGSDGDLEGHNVVLDKDRNGNWSIKHDTFPIGVVSPNANITYEEVNEGTETNPDFKTYVVVDEVFLWKRYDATQKIEEWLNNGNSPKVSMEITNIEGSFGKDNYFNIESFEFDAICALGSDIEPCFPMAQIENYSLIDIKKEFELMLKELKFTLEGGNQVELEQVTETVEEVVEVVETTEEAEVVEETKEEFQVEETTETVETTEEVVEETVTEEVVEEVETVDYQAKFTELEKEFTTLKENYANLETELTQLREFKSTKLAEERTIAENEIYERFTAELSEDEIAQVKETASEFTLEQLEEKLFTLVGKKKATFSKQIKKEKQPIKIELDFEEKEVVSPYGNLFDKISK